MGFTKETAHNGWLVLAALQMSASILHHDHARPWPGRVHRTGFQILVQQFVRVQLGTIRGMKHQNQFVFVCPLPLLDFTEFVNRMPIHDQEDLPPNETDPSSQGTKKHPRRNLFRFALGHQPPLRGRQSHPEMIQRFQRIVYDAG
jgi:hypothetical protein